MLFVGVLAIVVMTLLYTSKLRAAEELDERTFNDFWRKTKDGLENAHARTGDQAVLGSNKGKSSSTSKDDDDQLAKDMQARLKAAEQKAKDSANAKVLKPEKPEQVIGVGSSAGGQGKTAGDTSESRETEHEHEVELTINEVLKKSPGEALLPHVVVTVH